MKFKISISITEKNKEKYNGRVVVLYPLYAQTKVHVSNIGDGRLYGIIISGCIGETLNLNESADIYFNNLLTFSTPTILSAEESQKFKDTFPGWFI